MSNATPKSHSLLARPGLLERVAPAARFGSKTVRSKVAHSKAASGKAPWDKARIASALAALLLAPGLSGCILGTERPELNLEIPAAYREAQKHAPDAAVPALDWWRGFRSAELTSLMEQAQIFNLDIAAAVAQIVQADAQVGVAGAPLFPSVTGTATAERQHFGSQSGSSASLGNGLGSGAGSGGASTFSTFSTGLTASYMLDFWGKNRATLYAAEENATVARYNSFVGGVDADFGKPSPQYRIQKAPFYAAWSTPVIHDARSGLRINGSSQVLDFAGKAIPGLYAAGEAAGGFSQHGNGRALSQGIIAGRHAAARSA